MTTGTMQVRRTVSRVKGQSQLDFGPTGGVARSRTNDLETMSTLMARWASMERP